MPDKEGSDDEKTTKGVVNKKQKQMLNQEYIPEEEYDIARDQGRIRKTKGKSDATTMPVSDEVRKTQKVNTGPSALDRVLKKYGKSVMNVKKKSKKKANEELDLTKIAEAFGGYLLEKRSPEELAAEMKKRREEKFGKKTKPLSDEERAKQDFEKARSQRNFMSGDDPRYKSQESEFDTEGKTKPVTPKQQKKDSKPEGKIKLGDTTIGGKVKKIGTSTRGDRAKETTLLKKIERETPNVEKPFLDPGSDIDDFIEKGPQPYESPKRKSFKVNPRGRQKDKSGRYFAKPAQKGSETESEVIAKIKPTPNVRFAAPAGSGKPVTRQVKEPTDKQRRAQYRQKFDQSYSDFTKSGGKTDAPGGVLPGGKSQPAMDDATREFNRQQNILRRIRGQGMADSGAIPVGKLDAFPNPKTGPTSQIDPKPDSTFKDFRKKQKEAEPSKPDISTTDFLEKGTDRKLDMNNPVDRNIYLRQQGKEKFVQQAPEKFSKRGESQDSGLKTGGGFKTGRSGESVTMKPEKEKNPYISVFTDKKKRRETGDKIGRGTTNLASDALKQQSQSMTGAMGGLLFKTAFPASAGLEAGIQFNRGDKLGASLSALQSMGGGLGFGAGVLNALRMRSPNYAVPKPKSPKFDPKSPGPLAKKGQVSLGRRKGEKEAMMGAGGVVLSRILQNVRRAREQGGGGPIISPVRGGRAGRRSAKQ